MRQIFHTNLLILNVKNCRDYSAINNIEC